MVPSDHLVNHDLRSVNDLQAVDGRHLGNIVVRDILEKTQLSKAGIEE